MFKLLVVTPTMFPSLTEYVTEQITAISVLFPHLVIEQVNETDERYVMFSPSNNRFPAFLLFERGVFRTEFIGKVETIVLVDWLNSCSVNE